MEARKSLDNKTRLSWWFPRLPSGIPTPETVIIPYDGDSLIHLLNGEIPNEFGELRYRIEDVGDRLGWPLFLRTDYLSGKHSWKDSCFVFGRKCVARQVYRLIEESVMADTEGFPTDRWIARKLIPTKPAFWAFRGDMPIVKERRYFVQDDKVICHHPYWPSEAFDNVPVSVGCWRKLLDEINHENDEEIQLLSRLSSQVGARLGGVWSIDWLWSEFDGKWYLIDMAEAGISYHWYGCPHEMYA